MVYDLSLALTCLYLELGTMNCFSALMCLAVSISNIFKGFNNNCKQCHKSLVVAIAKNDDKKRIYKILWEYEKDKDVLKLCLQKRGIVLCQSVVVSLHDCGERFGRDTWKPWVSHLYPVCSWAFMISSGISLQIFSHVFHIVDFNS